MNWLATAGLGLAGLSTFFMMLIGAVDVLSTYLLNQPVPAALETTETLMVIVVFMALAYAQSRHQHISVELLYQRFPAGVQRAVRVLVGILGLAFFGMLAWQGWLLFWHSWLIREYASGIIRFPVYPSKACFALGASLMAVQQLRDLLPHAFGTGETRSSVTAGDV